MSQNMRVVLVVLVFMLGPALSAEDTNADGFTSLLVPIAFSSPLQTLPGAYGTIWTNEMWYHNGSTTGVMSLQDTGICIPHCIVALPAGSTGRLGGVESNGNNGAMLHVPNQAASGFQISARLMELSRNSQPTGVEIPVIAEGAFLTDERWLLSVPSGPLVRSALRVYDPRARRDTSVMVDFIAEDGTLIASATLRPGDDPVTTNRIGTPTFVPSVASILSITSVYPQLEPLERFHVRIRPLQEGREYWAMISVTHNDTQHVLLITPQP